MERRDRAVLLNFDVEEFDFAGRCGVDAYEFSSLGLEKLLDLLKENGISSTMFVTASFAKKESRLVRRLAKDHEVASHGIHHGITSFDHEEAALSKKVLERITGTEITGFRFPRLQSIELGLLKEAGYLYDSSISPTFMPGRYNHLRKRRSVTWHKRIAEVPVSALPLVRLPLMWLTFRNLGQMYARTGTRLCMKSPGFVNMYFHPWEFNELKGMDLPGIYSRNSGQMLISMLESYIDWCTKKGYSFMTFSEFLNPWDLASLS